MHGTWQILAVICSESPSAGGYDNARPARDHQRNRSRKVVEMRRLLPLACVIGLALTDSASARAQAKVAMPDPPWQAGVARTVITPSQLMWMSGYGARNKPAEGKIHDLWAKALALE